MPENTLYYGDNLDVLRRYVRDESVDLVYLDPPFNSRQDYNVLFAEKDGTLRDVAALLLVQVVGDHLVALRTLRADAVADRDRIVDQVRGQALEMGVLLR